jgi:phosphoesterase RecJ-like protein
MGSLLALARALHARGREAEVFLMGPVEGILLELAGPTPCTRLDRGEPADDYDRIVVVDTGAWSQLEPLVPWLRRHHQRVIGFDHHAHGDDVAARRIVDREAASTTMVLMPLLEVMGVRLGGEVGGVAEALFFGLATDTGWFRFANADARAFLAASRLLETGLDRSRLYRLSEECHRPQRLGLAARALGSVRFLRGASVAIMTIEPRDFIETGGSIEDLTNIVNLPMTVSTVRVSILLTQTEPGRTKISLRSKPPQDESEAARLEGVWDVDRLAQSFGGGGHVHAAGARVNMNLEDALRAVISAAGGTAGSEA